MEDKSIQFLEKLDELSAEVRLYFGSKNEAQALKEIKIDYQLSDDALDNLIYDIFIANFKFSILDSGLKAAKIPAPSQSRVAADILGKIFLPVASCLKLDIKAEIVKRGHQTDVYQRYVDDFSDLIEDKNLTALEDLVDLHESTFNPVEEENASLDLFNNSLKVVLNDSDVDAVIALNGALVYLLVNKPDFHNKINKSLFGNQEVITTKNLVWDEGAVRGTVANWLKDFIKENGSDIYNSVVLSRYLATSPNPQLLSEEERKIVRRLLKLYRNLIFFPESMNDVPMEAWEIVPVEKVSIEKQVPGSKPKISNETLVGNDKPVPEAKVVIKNIAKAPAPKAISIPQIETDLEGSKLASLLTKYSSDSLEAKVVKEEIKRRQTKN